MDPTPDVSVIVVALVLLISAAWLGTCALISLTGGWHRLGEKFRLASDIHGETFRFASMTLGSGFFPARYRNALFVTVGPAGISLSVIFPFRLLHPPLFIPWSAVESVQPERSWLTSHVAVSLRDFDKRLFFRGGAGNKIIQTFNMQARDAGVA